MEFESLVASAGAEVLRTLEAPLRRPDPRTLIRSGKLEELALALHPNSARSGGRGFRLESIAGAQSERALKCRVVDRTSVILDIFALRARSSEGMLQVELAQLRHLSTRLVGGWTPPGAAEGWYRPAGSR